MSDPERIRFGGRDTPAGFLFELTGGNLALDLANTREAPRATEARELLARYSDLVNWSRQAGLLDEAAAKEWLAAANEHPRLAARALERALELRETVHAIFSAPAPADTDLEALQRYASELSSHRTLARDGAAVAWRWKREGFDWMLWPVVEAATSLLTSPERERVRVCASSQCGWLFVDRSRRGNRRWCDMTVCGNRAKARRHYAKHAGPQPD